MRTMSTIDCTNFDKFVEHNAKVENSDLGVGDLKIKPRIRKRFDREKEREPSFSRGAVSDPIPLSLTSLRSRISEASIDYPHWRCKLRSSSKFLLPFGSQPVVAKASRPNHHHLLTVDSLSVVFSQ